MKERRKKAILTAALCGCLLALLALVNLWEFHSYTKNYNERLNAICAAIQVKYPEVSANELMEILNADSKAQTNFFEQYGIDLAEDSVVAGNAGTFRRFLTAEIAIAVFLGMAFFLMQLHFQRRQQESIREIVDYIEQINRGNYALKIDNNSEDELSLLKNEVYKTTIMLREVAETQKAEKIRLKDSLSDISHQLKTPITALMINLDNLQDNPELPLEMREQLVKRAIREVNSIKAMVQILLTLSKLDANTIEFERKDTALSQIIGDAIEQVEALSDLKGIEICPPKTEEVAQLSILCDAYWQTQCLSNILKNAVEHAAHKVEIRCEGNSVYNAIYVRNDGPAISEKDMRHVFERFYKGENAPRDSVGIGMAMAKTICEKDRGSLYVDVVEGFTEFSIKYMIR